jgi:hypothetical protein
MPCWRWSMIAWISGNDPLLLRRHVMKRFLLAAAASLLIGVMLGFSVAWIVRLSGAQHSETLDPVIERNVDEDGNGRDSGTSTSLSPAAAAQARPRIAFDAERAMAIVRMLSEDIGIRVEGPPQEWKAAEALKTCSLKEVLRVSICRSIICQRESRPTT